MSEKSKPRFHYRPGGALVCETEIPGVTQSLEMIDESFYGKGYFVGESMSGFTAKAIAESLGGVLVEESNNHD